MKITIKKIKNRYNSYNLSFSNMTEGKILAIKHALEIYQGQSSIASEINEALNKKILEMEKSD